MTKEIVKRLYSTEPEVRKNAVYQILFDRSHELISELKEAAVYEKDEEIAVLIAQTCLTLEAFRRDSSLERQILEFLQSRSGIAEMPLPMWEYLSTHGSSKMLIAVMGAMQETIPTNAQNFIEACLNSLDPEVRAMACTIAIHSGRPTHFAYVLNLITDSDKLVSETAFKVIRELPAEQMNIILDYALGSPDEWVIQNVAPFLPLIISKDVRKVIAKVQYHKHPLVAKKAREALKQLDTIPYVSKRLREKHKQKNEVSENAKEQAKDFAAAEADAEEKEDFATFKEQMEEKRRKRIEEERQKKEEEEKLANELSQTSDEEIAGFADELEEFEEEMHETAGDEAEPITEADESLSENLDFENEQAAFAELDFKEGELEEIPEPEELGNSAETETLHETLEIAESLSAAGQGAEAAKDAENEEPAEASQQAEGDAAAAGISSKQTQEVAEVPDFSQLSQEVQPTETHEKPSPAGADDSEILVKESSAEIDADDISTIATEDVEIEDFAEDVDIMVLDETQDAQPVAADQSQPAKPSSGSAKKSVPAAKTTQAAPPPVAPQREVPEKPAKKKPLPPGSVEIKPMPAAQTILKRYPSFLADPLAMLFNPELPEVHLQNIEIVLNNLLAYLNLCFLQSCMFFAPPSEAVNRSIKDCLKGRLVGPTAFRCLHNFALAMKQSRENPVFFTFTLATILAESNESNPLMMMRELKEYLKEPIEPLSETLPQAVEGLTEILRGLKAILNNSIVMKTPKGAREPFADLSGPLADVLPAEKRPAIELPPGEAVVLSRDGSEAFGLFPFFKYAKRKVVFAQPSEQELQVFLSRLEL